MNTLIASERFYSRKTFYCFALFFILLVLSCLVFSILKLEKSEKMSRSIARKQFTVCYKTEVTSIIRGHHVYKEVWDATIGEMLEAASDDREEAKEYDKYAVGLYKRDLLVGHIPIEISSLCFHFINQDPGNKIKALITRKRQREIGLVVPAKLIFITNNKRFSEVSENELIKRKNKFPTVTLKFKKKGVYRKFPFYLK